MEFTASNGSKVKITAAPFKDAMALKSAIGREISGADTKLDLDPSKGMAQDIDVAAFAKIGLLVDSSPAVNSALLSCLVRCTYNGEKITEATFEDVSAREAYYEIVMACLKVNLSPFFKGLLSQLNPYLSLIPKATSDASPT